MVNSLESENLLVPKAAHKEVLMKKKQKGKNLLQKQAITHKDLGQSTITHEEEKE